MPHPTREFARRALLRGAALGAVGLAIGGRAMAAPVGYGILGRPAPDLHASSWIDADSPTPSTPA